MNECVTVSLQFSVPYHLEKKTMAALKLSCPIKSFMHLAVFMHSGCYSWASTMFFYLKKIQMHGFDARLRLRRWVVFLVPYISNETKYMVLLWEWTNMIIFLGELDPTKYHNDSPYWGVLCTYRNAWFHEVQHEEKNTALINLIVNQCTSMILSILWDGISGSKMW